jgi:hypothetical protein
MSLQQQQNQVQVSRRAGHLQTSLAFLDAQKGMLPTIPAVPSVLLAATSAEVERHVHVLPGKEKPLPLSSVIQSTLCLPSFIVLILWLSKWGCICVNRLVFVYGVSERSLY